MKKPTKIDYELLVQNAVRNGIRDLLQTVSKEGLPGNHYFYIEFLTHFPGVQLSEELRATYPADMMISIQYDYFDLDVDTYGFGVTLVFDDEDERIYIPFAAMTHFSDPSVEFGFDFIPTLDRFESQEISDLLTELTQDSEDGAISKKASREEQESVTAHDNVVSFEFFKKKQ